MGAAMNSNYYHGPYGWGGYGMYGGYYGAGYNDVLDHREDMAHTGGRHYENTHENSPIENEAFSISTVVSGVRERNGL